MNPYFSEIYDRIREVTNAPTQVALAKVLGIRQSSISDAKRRGSIPPEWYLTLFDRFGLNPDWLKKGVGPMYLRTETGYEPSDDSLTIRLAEETGQYGNPMEQGVPIPVLHCDVKLGQTQEEPELKAVAMLCVPQHFARQNCKVLQVNSPAMEPTIQRNAFVGVDTSSRTPVAGALFALMSQVEGVIIRRLYASEEPGRLLLRTDAPGHPDISMPLDQVARTMMGRVAWVLQEF